MADYKIKMVPGGAKTEKISISQNDIGRAFSICLVDANYNPYVIPEDAVITIQGTKPSGLGFTVSGSFSGCNVFFSTTAEMSDEAGHIPCEVKIVDGENVIGSANATLYVEANPHPDDVTDGIAEHVVDTITALVEEAEEHENQAHIYALNSEAYAVQALDAARRAEEAAEHGGGGYSPTANVVKVGDTATITITDVHGTTTATIKDGQDGQDGQDGAPGAPGSPGRDGQDGQDGQDGYSPSIAAVRSGDVVTITITDATHTETVTISDGEDGATGPAGPAGPAGQNGYTPVRGTDYWTAADQAAIVADVLAEMTDAETEGM